MIRKFLYEIVQEILDSDDREATFKEWYNKSKQFAEFVDVTYNKKYNWEFDRNYYKKPRNMRERGGVEGEWYQVVRLVQRNLIKVNNESPNFVKRLDRILDNCNFKDIKILLCMLKSRSIHYLNTKKVYEWYPELEGKEEDE